MEQTHRPDLVYVVDNLDAPWHVSATADGEQFLVVRNGTPITVPLVNVINDLAEHRTMVGRLRKQMDSWETGSEHASPVPQQVHRPRCVNEAIRRDRSAVD